MINLYDLSCKHLYDILCNINHAIFMINTNTFIALGKVGVNNLTSQDRKPRNNLIFDKGGKNIQWGNNSILINGAGKTGQLHVKQ